MVILGQILQGLVKNMIFIKNILVPIFGQAHSYVKLRAVFKQLVLLNPPQDILDMVSILWQNLSATFEQKEDLKRAVLDKRIKQKAV